MKAALENRVLRLLLEGDTALVRFWFALCSYGWAAFIFFATDQFLLEHPESYHLARAEQLGVLFAVYATATMYGVVTRRFSVPLLFVEGALGTFLWGGIGIVDMLAQGSVGPAFGGGLIALYLLMRYPTHYTKGPK